MVPEVPRLIVRYVVTVPVPMPHHVVSSAEETGDSFDESEQGCAFAVRLPPPDALRSDGKHLAQVTFASMQRSSQPWTTYDS